LREGIKGRGKLHPEIQSLIAPTLTLPREGGGNFRLLTRPSSFISIKFADTGFPGGALQHVDVVKKILFSSKLSWQ
jgi:hypothetical protein